MHGKINYYSAKAGVGSLIDNLKKAYDFKIASWHDTSAIPSVGMYIVYFLDDRGKLSDIKASKYQSFKNNPFLSEADFWATNDDTQLDDLEEKRREDIVNERVKEIVLQDITEIGLTKTSEECMKNVFANHYEIIQDNEDLLEKNVVFEFNYAVLKRFLEKTMLQLVTLDKRIGADEFSEVRQKIIKVEYLLGSLTKVADPDNIALTKDYFLKYQIEYTAIKRAFGNLKDTLAMLNNRVANIQKELDAMPNKIQASASNDEKLKLKTLREKKLQEKKEAELDLEQKQPVFESLGELLREFEQQYVSEFPEFYKTNKDLLKLKLHKLLNRLADEFDTKLYVKASSSDVITTGFYGQGVDGTFSTMTFVKYYVTRLNKDLMKEPDKVLYELYLRYQKSVVMKFAIVTGDTTRGQDLKVSLLAQDKHIRVILFNRAIEFYSVCDSETFAMIFVDTNMRGADAQELVEKGKDSNKNSKSVYVVFDS